MKPHRALGADHPRRASRFVRVSAPGKLILFGEHSAVYGEPALIAALGLRTEACYGFNGENTGGIPVESAIELDLPDLFAHRIATWKEIEEKARDGLERWLRFADGRMPFRPAAAAKHDAADLILVALGEARRALVKSEAGQADDIGSAASDDRFWAADEERRGQDWPTSLRLSSDLPLGSGCGSSAALATVVVAGLARATGVGLTLGEIELAVLEVERRQHGRPSGVDAATVLRGGLLWSEARAESRRFTSIEDSKGLLHGFRAVQSGSPNETTGEVVAAVARRREESPLAVAAAISGLGDHARAARALLQGAAAPGDRAEMTSLVRLASRALEVLGVVPPRVAALIRGIEARGAAAKVSGAGALSDPGAGVLLVYDPGSCLGSFLRDQGLIELEAMLAAPGLRAEP